jgi:hypothetical protein
MFECDKGHAARGRVPLARLRTYSAARRGGEKRERLREKVRENERKVVYTGEIERNLSNELQRETE